MRYISSQLLLFESRLCRKQKEIEASLAQREAIILKQQRVIRKLQSRLAEKTTEIRDSPTCDVLDRLDSLGDSDSAVVLEEPLDDLTPPRFVHFSFLNTKKHILQVYFNIFDSYDTPFHLLISRILNYQQFYFVLYDLYSCTALPDTRREIMESAF